MMAKTSGPAPGSSRRSRIALRTHSVTSSQEGQARSTPHSGLALPGETLDIRGTRARHEAERVQARTLGDLVFISRGGGLLLLFAVRRLTMLCVRERERERERARVSDKRQEATHHARLAADGCGASSRERRTAAERGCCVSTPRWSGLGQVDSEPMEPWCSCLACSPCCCAWIASRASDRFDVCLCQRWELCSTACCSEVCA